MNKIGLFKIALKALVVNKFRTLLTMLGIIIGVGSVIAMLAIGQGSKKSIQDEISKMGSNMIFIMPGNMAARGVMMGHSESQSLTLDDYKALQEQSTYLSHLTPVVSASGQAIFGRNNSPVSMMGTNTDILDIRKYEIESGDMFTERDIKISSKVCVIGQTVKDELFSEGEDPIGQTIRFDKIPFKVIGLLKAKGQSGMGQDQDNIIIAPYTCVQKRILAITHINSIYASTQNEEVATEAQEEITEILRDNHKLKESDDDDFEIRSQQEMITAFSSTSKILTVLLAVIAGISLIVGGIGIMNIMYVSVTERTREIGIRMAVGGRDFDILSQFLIEAILISFFGGLIGILLGVGSSFMIKNILNWPISISMYSIVLSFAVCTIIGVFFGWYPAHKASKLDPIDALRYE